MMVGGDVVYIYSIQCNHANYTFMLSKSSNSSQDSIHLIEMVCN